MMEKITYLPASLIRITCFLAALIIPMTIYADPVLEDEHNGVRIIVWSNGTAYYNIGLDGQPGSSVCTSSCKKEVDCGENEAECRKLLEEAEAEDEKSKKNAKNGTVPVSPARITGKLDFDSLRRLPAKKTVKVISKKEFLRRVRK